MQALSHSAYANFVAVVDVDAGGGGDVLAHGLAHQVVVVVVNLTRLRLLGHNLVDARYVVGGVAHALVDNLTVLDHMAQAAILLVVGIGVGLTCERRQQVAHVTAVEPDTLDHIAHRVTILLNVRIATAGYSFDLYRLNLSEVLCGQYRF